MSSGKNTQILRISGINLSGQENIILKVASGLLAAHNIAAQVVEPGDTAAEILVIHGATGAERESLPQPSEGQVRILIHDTEAGADNPQQGSATLHMVRPVRVQALNHVLHEACVRHQTGMVDKPASAPVAAAPATTTAVNPARPASLFHALLAAKQQHKIVSLNVIPEDSKFLIDGIGGGVYIKAGHIGKEEFKKAAQYGSDALEARILPDDYQKPDVDQSTAIKLDRALWSASTHSRHGALIDGHTMESPCRLMAWPNFARYDILPSQVKLAALMTKAPNRSLLELQKASDLPTLDIINFFNAAVAIGLVNAQKSSTVSSVASENRKSPNKKRRGLLSKLAQHLSKAS